MPSPFDVLVGTWATEATHPAMPEVVVPGRVTFEWLTGDQYLIQRVHNEHDQFPDSISVIGPPEGGDGLLMEYFDSRGVRRTYNISLVEGALRIWRDDPEFAQRFSAELDDDGFEGLWQVARTAGDWRDDLAVSYRRILEPPS
jgi:hypothetical protein